MSAAICPHCRSLNVRTGYPLSAGENHCQTCNYIGPVASFHLHDMIAKDLISLPLTLRINVPIEPAISQLDADRARYKPRPGERPSARRYWWQEKDDPS